MKRFDLNDVFSGNPEAIAEYEAEGKQLDYDVSTIAIRELENDRINNFCHAIEEAADCRSTERKHKLDGGLTIGVDIHGSWGVLERDHWLDDMACRIHANCAATTIKRLYLESVAARMDEGAAISDSLRILVDYLRRHDQLR